MAAPQKQFNVISFLILLLTGLMGFMGKSALNTLGEMSSTMVQMNNAIGKQGIEINYNTDNNKNLEIRTTNLEKSDAMQNLEREKNKGKIEGLDKRTSCLENKR